MEIRIPRVQKEKEQLAAMDKQKEKLMASKFGSCDLCCCHCHGEYFILSDLSSTEKQEKLD